MKETAEISESLIPYFALPDEIGNSEELLKKRLTEEIQYLIDYNLDKLWNILYRVDVAEKKVKVIIATTPFAEHASHIATLIIERQKEKIISRKKYKKE